MLILVLCAVLCSLVMSSYPYDFSILTYVSSTFYIVKHQLLLSLKDFPHVLLSECVQVINNGNVLLKL